MNKKRMVFYLFAAIPIALLIIFCVKSTDGFESSDIQGPVGSPLFESRIESYLTNGAHTPQSNSFERPRTQADLPVVKPYDSRTEKVMPTMLAVNLGETLFSATTKMTALSDSSKDETELKYYTMENLDQLIGVTCAEPCFWKSAIRLTQDEMATYKNWTLTKVNVAFSTQGGCPSIDVRIYIYDKGTNIKPGPIIASNTIYTLNTTGVTTIPLVTPVELSGHEDLWVAVEWNQIHFNNGYAWIDTLSGPHIQNKSDFVWTGSGWSQLHDLLPTCDGRWGIGAIIEGQGVTQLAIGNIRGPWWISADVQNIGEDDATNVTWSITATGGLFKRINASTTGAATVLVVGASKQMNSGIFLGFGKINIVITAKAYNAPEVLATKSAFLLGPFVVGIK
jgi:hypothetical protein